MSYTVRADGVTIDDPSMAGEGYVLIDPVIEEELNAFPTFEFTVPSTHPLIDTISAHHTIITVSNGDEEIFRGRVMETTMDFYRNMEVYCEGTMGFLCDSVLQPFVYSGDVKSFLEQLLDNHNEQIGGQDDPRYIELGTVSLSTDDEGNIEDDSITRSSESAMTTWEAISSRIIDELGGYVWISKSGSVYKLNYYQELSIDITTDQKVEYAINLVDLEEYMDSSSVITCLIPYGAQVSEGEHAESEDEDEDETEEEDDTDWNDARNYPEESYSLGENETHDSPYTAEPQAVDDTIVTWSGNRLTLNGLRRSARHAANDEDEMPLGDALYADVDDDGNEVEYENEIDKIAIKSADGIAMWGEIWGTEVFDDMTEVQGQDGSGLYSAAYWWLQEQIQSSTELTLTAVDLHLMDADIDRIHLGDYVRVYSEPHGYNRYMACIKTHTELRSPESDSVTLGASFNSLTQSLVGTQELASYIYDVEGTLTTTRNQLSSAEDILTQVQEQVDALESALSNLSTYVTTAQNLIVQLNAEVSTLQELYDAMETAGIDVDYITALYDKITGVSDDYDNLYAQYQSLSASLSSLSSSYSTVDAAYEALSDKYDSLYDDVESFTILVTDCFTVTTGDSEDGSTSIIGATIDTSYLYLDSALSIINYDDDGDSYIMGSLGYLSGEDDYGTTDGIGLVYYAQDEDTEATSYIILTESGARFQSGDYSFWLTGKPGEGGQFGISCDRAEITCLGDNEDNSSSGQLSVTAETSITLTAGGHTLTINSSGIFADGTQL